MGDFIPLAVVEFYPPPPSPLPQANHVPNVEGVLPLTNPNSVFLMSLSISICNVVHKRNTCFSYIRMVYISVLTVQTLCKPYNNHVFSTLTIDYCHLN